MAENLLKSAMVALCCWTFVGCSGSGAPVTSPAAAAARVLAADAELGSVRNEGPRTQPLHQAIETYLAGMDALDLSGCSPEFTKAFRAHRNAWAKSIPFFAQFEDRRGEMHDLFEEIRATHREPLEKVEEEIWGTWNDVEQASPPSSED